MLSKAKLSVQFDTENIHEVFTDLLISLKKSKPVYTKL